MLFPPSPNDERRAIGPAALAALGVVFGDIGTSPLYALKACFAHEYGLQLTPANVFGVLSLIIWSLTLVVSVKYIVFVMRADNHGEGGILALLALIRQPTTAARARPVSPLVVALGLFGAALLYGDGVITPAISVLSAVEGVKVQAPELGHVVLPLSLVILAVLFGGQRFGAARIGRVFGPLMLAWFLVIGMLGAAEVFRAPEIFLAVNPLEAFRFFAAHRIRGVAVLGAVVLAVTGAEALYADMGHFGKHPIRMAWFGLVFPALLINYLGQGALLLRSPAAVENPFYLLAPRVALYPLIGLATLATVIASQALISGAFSLTNQAMHLGYSPRMRVVHSSPSAEGQIYIPTINGVLMIACLLLVAGFRSSTRLAAAYGIAVTGTMAATSVLFFVVARSRWHWSRTTAGLLTAAFLGIDLTFFGTNLLKFAAGGWVPLCIAIFVYTLMTTWAAGHDYLVEARRAGAISLTGCFQRLDADGVHRAPGTAVVLSAHPDGVPALLLRLIAHTKTLPETVVLLSLVSADVPFVSDADQITVERLSHGFMRVTMRIGFMETHDVARMLAGVQDSTGTGATANPVFYAAREHVVPTGSSGMARWRKRLFIIMLRTAPSAVDFFRLPASATVELGVEVMI
ncbi:MAG TPA: potassium transporter Kup [Gemmatimonadaceae bacterium]